ncbi:cytochrome c biogenesis CcdA family protein [Rhodoglobus aureus]|uniref:Cytochrome c biogenesis CcdA family protein n=1 Tax=Rhodoglobus aureus TaxID=191497 RepID=A0ABN1VW08_9MICO
MTALLILAFGAGMLAPINPCGFAVLPAFLAYGTGTATADATRGSWARLVAGLRSGVTLTLGFTGTFTVFGLLVAVGMRPLIGAIPWLAAVLGAVFVLLGLGMLIGLRIPLGWTALSSVGQNRKSGGMFAFGVGYAVASASCSLALLLAVVTQALAGTGWGSVLLVFAAYAAGSSVLLITLSVVTTFAGTVMTRYLRRLMPHMNRITGIVLALSGGYLLAYWLPQLFGGAPGTTVLSGIAVPLSTWVSSNQLFILTVGGVLVVVILIGAMLRRIRSRRSAAADESHRQAAEDDCCTPTLDPGQRHP